MKKKRRSPIKHRVKKHERGRTLVKAHTRGSRAPAKKLKPILRLSRVVIHKSVENPVLARQFLKDLLDVLPKSHLRDLKRIIVKQDLGEFVFKGQVVKMGANYKPPAKIMEIREDNLLNPSSIFHELGHHVHFNIIDDEAVDTWVAVWRKNIAKMPSEYARHIAGEGFAECYAAYYLSKSKNTRYRPYGYPWVYKLPVEVKEWFKKHVDK